MLRKAAYRSVEAATQPPTGEPHDNGERSKETAPRSCAAQQETPRPQVHPPEEIQEEAGISRRHRGRRFAHEWCRYRLDVVGGIVHGRGVRDTDRSSSSPLRERSSKTRGGHPRSSRRPSEATPLDPGTHIQNRRPTRFSSPMAAGTSAAEVARKPLRKRVTAREQLASLLRGDRDMHLLHQSLNRRRRADR